MDDGDVTGRRALGDRAGDLAGGDERGDGARADRLAALVDDEAAVGVTVEGQPDVGAVLDDGGLQVDEVLGLERVGLVVGEGAVELEVEGHDLERQRGQAGAGAEHGGDRVAAHAVAGVDDDLERPDAGEVDQRAQEGGVVGEQVALVDGAGTRAGVLGRRCRRAVEQPLARSRISARPVSWPTGRAPERHSLMPLYCGGVVARGEHGAGQVERAAGVVEAVGASTGR